MMFFFLFLLIQKSCSELKQLPDGKSLRQSLSDCVVSASQKYFKGGESITFSLPVVEVYPNYSSSTVLNGLLIPGLMKENKWALQIKNFIKCKQQCETLQNYLRLTKTMNYIIQIRRENELIKNLNILSKLQSWNPHAKFIIISPTIFHEPLNLASEIMETLWNMKVLNAVVLLPDPIKNLYFNVYTWYPYHNNNCGDDFTKIELIDSCSLGIIENNSTWFDEIIPKKLNNCTFVIKLINLPPYVLKIENNSYGVSDYYFIDKGIEVNLLNTIAKIINIKWKYIFSNESLVWGNIDFNGIATGPLADLKNEIIDGLAGSYPQTLETNLYFDESTSYMQESLIFCVPSKKKFNNWRNLISFLDFKVWCLTLLFYIIITLLSWKLSNQHDLNSLIYAFLNSFSVLVGIAIFQQPKRSVVRYLMTLLIFFGLILSTAYQTILISILTDRHEEQNIKSIEDIYTYKLKTYFLPVTNIFFKDSDQSINKFSKEILKNWNDCYNPNKCLEEVAYKKTAAFCVPLAFKKYVFNNYLSKNSEPLLYCFKKILVNYPINIIMRNGFPIYKRVNDIIKSISTSGLILKWEHDIIHNRYKLKTNSTNFEDIYEKPNTLNFKSLQPVFSMIIIGNCLAIITFLLEIICHKWITL